MTLAVRSPTTPESPLAQWDARWKLAAIVVVAAAVASLQHALPAATAALASLLLVGLARLPARRVVAHLGLLALGLVPFALILPFTLEDGWRVAGVLVLRGFALGLLALVLAGTAPVPTTLAAARALGAPGTAILVGQLAYRYAFVLMDEARRVAIAARVRGFRARANRHGYRTLGHMGGAILVRGLDRSERVRVAMAVRGFDGTPRTLTPWQTRPADALAALVALACAASLVAWDRLTA